MYSQAKGFQNAARWVIEYFTSVTVPILPSPTCTFAISHPTGTHIGRSTTLSVRCTGEIVLNTTLSVDISCSTGRLIANAKLTRKLTKSLIVKIEVQQVLIFNLGNLDDGLVVQMLLKSHNLARHQLVCLILVLASVAQQVVSVLRLPAIRKVAEIQSISCSYASQVWF